MVRLRGKTNPNPAMRGFFPRQLTHRQPSASMSNLFTIPNELLDQIVSDLDPRTTFYLLLSCRSHSSRLLPVMHLHAIAPKDGTPALHWAAFKGFLPLVQYLLTIYPVDLVNATGETPLQDAAMACRTLVIEVLLLQGAAVNRISRMGYSALTSVCRGELRNTAIAEATMRILLAHGTNVHADGLYLPLQDAIIWCASRAALLFLEAGASPDGKDTAGKPLVVEAQESWCMEIMQMLLDHGANPDATSEWNTTATTDAAGYGHFVTVQVLADHAANLNLGNRDGHTALSMACMSERNEHIVDYLVRYDGFDVNGVNLGERAPVYLTVLKGYRAAFMTLLQRGASMDDVNNKGWSIVHFAVLNRRHQIIRALLDHGVSIETMDEEGITPLMEAIMLNDRPMMTMLIDHQPDRSRDEFATLILACSLHSATMVELLLEWGTDIKRVVETGMTAMAKAKLQGLYSLVKILASYGGKSASD